MKKRVFFIIIIIIAIVAIIGYKFFYYQISLRDIKNNNKTYESFYNVEILGTDLASLINKIEDLNKKNNEYHMNNNYNSINIDVKFKEIQNAVNFEKIQQNEISKFIYNFGATSFKCTKIEYYEKTGAVSYMYFEEI